MTSYLSEWLSSINQQTASVGEDAEKRKPLCTVGRNADWCSHSRKQHGISSKNKKGNAYDSAILILGVYPKKPKTLI